MILLILQDLLSVLVTFCPCAYHTTDHILMLPKVCGSTAPFFYYLTCKASVGLVISLLVWYDTSFKDSSGPIACLLLQNWGLNTEI